MSDSEQKENVAMEVTPNDGAPATKKAKGDEQVTVQFESETGQHPFPSFSVPADISQKKLEVLIQALIKQHNDDEGADEDEEDFIDPDRPFLFYLAQEEIKDKLAEVLAKVDVNKERTVPIVYKPQAVFKVKPVTRCSSSMPGHTKPVVVTLFSPDGRYLASGAGDNTVRFWDLTTETPLHEGRIHKQYVLALAWSPDGGRLASGDKSGVIVVWDPKTGAQANKSLLGHKQWITALAWQPLHLTKEGSESSPDCLVRKLASASKDGAIRVWDVGTSRCLFSLTSHTKSVTCLKWGGQDLIYSASQDRTIKVWRAEDGVLCRTLQGHGHWVNVLALNTDYAMRTGAFDPSKASVVHADSNEPAAVTRKRALTRYNAAVKTVGSELMVSGSDDFTMFMWKPCSEKKSLARMTGHQQLVNDVKFSPDCRIIASASFDKSVRIWDGQTGKFLATLRGHVQAVYQLAFSADSRLLVSGSADSTLKCWSMAKRQLDVDLPGHGDEVYAVDWSPDGQRVCSGGKDTLIRIWKR